MATDPKGEQAERCSKCLTTRDGADLCYCPSACTCLGACWCTACYNEHQDRHAAITRAALERARDAQCPDGCGAGRPMRLPEDGFHYPAFKCTATPIRALLDALEAAP